VIVQIIECLVSANVSAKSIIAEINAVTKTGWTALMMAVDRGNVETVRLLLKCGADASIKSQSKESAQMLIAAHRNQPTFPYQVLKDLLDGKRA
jgi:ankyrin repeat protein